MPSPPSVAEILDTRHKALYLLALQRLRSHADAEDAVQETALRCLSVDWHDVASPDAMLTTIHLNVIRDMKRRHASRHDHGAGTPGALPADLPGRVAAPDPSPEQVAYWRQRLSHVAACIQALPPRARRVFTLRRFHGLSHAEIAEREHMSVAAVEKNVVRALRRLREETAND